MVKCSSCLSSSSLRYTRPPGNCEDCGVVTPYQDLLCTVCSNAKQICQCCRSRKIQANDPHSTQYNNEQSDNNNHMYAQQTTNSIFAQTMPASSSQATTLSINTQPQYDLAASFSGQISTPTHYSSQTYQQTQPSTASSQLATPKQDSSTQSFFPTSTSPALSVATLSNSYQGSQHSSLPTTPAHRKQMVVYPTSNASATHTAVIEHSKASNHLTTFNTSGAAATTSLVPASPPPPQTMHQLAYEAQQSVAGPLSPSLFVRANSLGLALTPQLNNNTTHSAGFLSLNPHACSPLILLHIIFEHYCSFNTNEVANKMTISRWRKLCADANILYSASQNPRGLSSERLDILYTSVTKPSSGSRIKMNEDLFVESMGTIALWLFGNTSEREKEREGRKLKHLPLVIQEQLEAKKQAELRHVLPLLLQQHLLPLVERILTTPTNMTTGATPYALATVLPPRHAAFPSDITALLRKYEEGLKRIFIRLTRQAYDLIPRVDEVFSHPFLFEAFLLFLKSYDFLPQFLSIRQALSLFLYSATGLTHTGWDTVGGQSGVATGVNGGKDGSLSSASAVASNALAVSSSDGSHSGQTSAALYASRHLSLDARSLHINERGQSVHALSQSSVAIQRKNGAPPSALGPNTMSVEQPALSFNDFLHCLVYTAYFIFDAVHIAPRERVEMVLNKIDSVSRELAFVPEPTHLSAPLTAASAASAAAPELSFHAATGSITGQDNALLALLAALEQLRVSPASASSDAAAAPAAPLLPTTGLSASAMIAALSTLSPSLAASLASHTSSFISPSALACAPTHIARLFTADQLAVAQQLFTLYANDQAEQSFSQQLHKAKFQKLVRDARLTANSARQLRKLKQQQQQQQQQQPPPSPSGQAKKSGATRAQRRATAPLSSPLSARRTQFDSDRADAHERQFADDDEGEGEDESESEGARQRLEEIEAFLHGDFTQADIDLVVARLLAAHAPATAASMAHRLPSAAPAAQRSRQAQRSVFNRTAASPNALNLSVDADEPQALKRGHASFLVFTDFLLALAEIARRKFNLHKLLAAAALPTATATAHALAQNGGLPVHLSVPRALELLTAHYLRPLLARRLAGLRQQRQRVAQTSALVSPAQLAFPHHADLLLAAQARGQQQLAQAGHHLASAPHNHHQPQLLLTAGAGAGVSGALDRLLLPSSASSTHTPNSPAAAASASASRRKTHTGAFDASATLRAYHAAAGGATDEKGDPDEWGEEEEELRPVLDEEGARDVAALTLSGRSLLGDDSAAAELEERHLLAYPNLSCVLPSAPSVDSAAVLREDAAVRDVLLRTYRPALSRLFTTLAWLGLQAGPLHGAHVPAAATFPIHTPGATLPWAQFVRSRATLSEAVLRRFLRRVELSPHLVAPKVVTLFLHELHARFDTPRNEFVLTFAHFLQLLVKLAQELYSSPTYADYSSLAAKLELLLLHLDGYPLHPTTNGTTNGTLGSSAVTTCASNRLSQSVLQSVAPVTHLIGFKGFKHGRARADARAGQPDAVFSALGAASHNALARNAAAIALQQARQRPSGPGVTGGLGGGYGGGGSGSSSTGSGVWKTKDVLLQLEQERETPLLLQATAVPSHELQLQQQQQQQLLLLGGDSAHLGLQLQSPPDYLAAAGGGGQASTGGGPLVISANAPAAAVESVPALSTAFPLSPTSRVRRSTLPSSVVSASVGPLVAGTIGDTMSPTKTYFANTPFHPKDNTVVLGPPHAPQNNRPDV